MTRAQAAAMAAAADADDDDNNNDRNGSTTPTDDIPTKEREVLGELTPNLDGESGQLTVQDEEQDMVNEAAESRDLGHDEVEKDVDEKGAGAKVEKGTRLSATTSTASLTWTQHPLLHLHPQLRQRSQTTFQSTRTTP